MSSDSLTYAAPGRGRGRIRSGRRVRVAALLARPELPALLGIAAVLNLWALSINGWANTYYSAAVRSMTTSWHNFLFVSLDPSGLMTVDKPPLSLWVQALSARVFGLHPLSMLLPQALMGMGAVALVYDLTRRRFGRVAGAVAGLVLATTPVAVAVSRHNNPDELLVLCSVAAMWCGLRALDTGRTRWLVLSGVTVGLGFETKMGVALLVVPGIALAWIWTRVLTVSALRARLRATGQLLAGGLAMLVVGGAWPLLVTLTPASDRPWISGTSDNSIWSLIFGYNGLGRVAGQTGGPAGGAGPGGGGGTMFGGATGPLRLLQTGLGDQAGWLLGFTLVSGLAVLALTRLRPRDPRTGWLLTVGGAFLCTAVVFSFASGIFHPYYVSLLAPLAALLIGGGVGEMLPAPLGVAFSSCALRAIGPLAIIGGAVTELVVLHELSGALAWTKPLIVVAAGAGAIVLALGLSTLVRGAVVAAALVALLAAPATWAAQTLGDTTSPTFPTGGPASAAGGGPGAGARPPGAFNRFGGAPAGAGGAPFAGGPGVGRGPGGGGPFGGGGGPGGGGPFGSASNLTAAIRYASAHGGGTIGVSSQSSAAAAILASHAPVAGLGGFSGRESSVTASWIADEVRAGKLRWILPDAAGGGGLPGDTRTGSRSAISLVERACRAVQIPGTSSAGGGTSSAAGGTSATAGGTSATTATMYDCAGRAEAILNAVRRSS